MSKKINMDNPNTLAQYVVKEQSFTYHAADAKVVCPHDIGKTAEECKDFLLAIGYEHRGVVKKLLS